MSKIKSPCLRHVLSVGITAAIAASCFGSVHAQTIAEITELQRAKLLADLSKSKTDAEPVKQAIDPQAVAMRKAAATQSGLSVHALYVRGSGNYIAELTDGRNLRMAIPGAVYGPNKIVSVRPTGVEVTSLNCKKDCNQTRVVPVGGAF